MIIGNRPRIYVDFIANKGFGEQMKFLDSNGLSRLWTKIKDYTKASNIPQTAISGATSVDAALSSLKTSVDNIIDDEYSQKNTYAKTKIEGTTAAYHRRFRGKYLGNALTTAQSNAIKARTFDDLFVGDYWTIGGVNYRIADIDYFYNCGDTPLTTGHLVIVPDTHLAEGVMNDANTTDSGYTGSKMRSSSGALTTARNTVINAFGNAHVLTYRDLLTISIGGWSWTDARVELMNEIAVYGTNVWSYDGYSTGVMKTQFELFRQAPEYINIKRVDWWLRSSNSAASFACVNAGGDADAGGASNSGGVRPFFLLS